MRSTDRTGGSGWQQAIAGVLLMAAGVILLLDRRDVIEIGSIWRWAPLILAVIVIFKATASGPKRDVGGGLELMIFALWVVACLHDWNGLTFVNSWPLVFVGVGVKMVVNSLVPPKPKAPKEAKGEGHA